MSRSLVSSVTNKLRASLSMRSEGISDFVMFFHSIASSTSQLAAVYVQVVLVHGSNQLPFPYQLCQPGLDATNWRAELAIRFGVILLSSDTNQILKFLLRFLVPRTKLLCPVQTQSSRLARGRSPRAIAPAQARAAQVFRPARPARAAAMPKPRARAFFLHSSRIQPLKKSRLADQGMISGERQPVRRISTPSTSSYSGP